MNTVLEIQNLKCGGCANTVTKGVSAIDNIREVSVDVENNKVSFAHVSEEDVENVRKALLKMGYPIAGETNPLVTRAKSYVSCAIGRIG